MNECGNRLGLLTVVYSLPGIVKGKRNRKSREIKAKNATFTVIVFIDLSYKPVP